jgi:hypothetical protein
MPVKKILISSLIIFVFVFFFEALLHGFLLRGIYESTAQLWRPYEEMKAFFPYSLTIQLGFSVIISLFYAVIIKEKTMKNALSFGAFLGLLFGWTQLGLYAYMPIPFMLAQAWFFGVFLESVVIGGVLGLVYRE